MIAEDVCLTDTTKRPRVDTYLFKMNAVDEALIDAIVHNDWKINQPLVSLFDDRLEILSYGGFPGNETKDDFYRGVSNPRNQSLARIFQNLDITEQTGYEVPTIVKEYGKGAFKITDRYVNVITPFNQEVIKSRGAINGAINDKLNNNEKDVVSFLILSPMATYRDMASKCGISLRTVARVISDLQGRGG